MCTPYLYTHIYSGTNADNENCTLNDDDTRLIGGAVNSEGIVQVCLNGTWAMVCAEAWTEKEAKVVCVQRSGVSGGI